MVEESVLYFEGKYSDTRRFVIHNWTTEDILSYWDGKPIVINAGDMYECDHAIARKLTKELVDREMFRKAEEDFKAAGDNKTYAEKARERAEMAVLNRILRKPYEDKTISEIKAGTNPILDRVRAETEAKIRAEYGNAKEIKTPPGSLSNDKAGEKVEFAEK